MEGIMGHLNYYEFISFISRPNGIWHQEIISNIVLLVFQKLSPLNAVTYRLDVMLRFLAYISQIEANWLSIACSLVQDLPTDAYTITTIVIIMRTLPTPKVTMVNKLLSEQYQLSRQHAVAPNLDIRAAKNICIVLNCLVDKLVGVQTTQIFTNNVCNYFCHIFMNSKRHNDMELQMRALLTLEKFAVTKENKEKIVKTLGFRNNKLAFLEKLCEDNTSEYSIRRQIGFCARWALDNIFPKPGRQLSYERVNTSNIKGMLKNETANIYLKYSPDLMEIRNDTIKSLTLYGNCEVDHGVWFYEVTVVTNGSLTIGWALTGADMEKPVGNEEYSIGFEGNRRYLWYYKDAYVIGLGRWRENDIIGCLLDLDKKTMTFFLNGEASMVISEDFFSFVGESTKFFPAITMSPFQQCIVNLGQAPFRTAPYTTEFCALNSVGQLTPQQIKMYIMPRRALQEAESAYNASEDACDICCDRTADVTLKPCGHRSLCSICSMKIHQCPLCRAHIVKRR